MNNDEDIYNLVLEISSSIEKYKDKIDFHHLLGILVNICKMLGETEMIKNKEFRRLLKQIIELKDS